MLYLLAKLPVNNDMVARTDFVAPALSPGLDAQLEDCGIDATGTVTAMLLVLGSSRFPAPIIY